jgi:heme/copper-type cytochrome/quinol oxidase subunit 2
MSRQARIGLVVATLVVLVVAFIVVSPGGDDSDKTSAPTTAVGPPALTATGAESAPTPAPPPAPTFETIQVKAGQPVGGIKTITVNKGDQARIQVSSPDTTDEIHLHGYDLMRDLKAGGRVRFSFKAKDDGIYEIVLVGSGTQIGKLVVEP